MYFLDSRFYRLEKLLSQLEPFKQKPKHQEISGEAPRLLFGM